METSFDLLQGVHALCEDVVPGDDHEDGHGAVHQGQGAVLQLASKDALAEIFQNYFINFANEMFVCWFKTCANRSTP